MLPSGMCSSSPSEMVDLYFSVCSGAVAGREGPGASSSLCKFILGERFIVAHLQILWLFKRLVMSLLGSVARLCVPLWFAVQPFSPFRGQALPWLLEGPAGREDSLASPTIAPKKHVASRSAAALIDARSVSSFWCVSDTGTNKGPRCSPPPQFTATPPPR